ncbi:g6597 [Coccomyxa elongata]
MHRGSTRTPAGKLQEDSHPAGSLEGPGTSRSTEVCSKLCSRWPARRDQICAVLDVLGEPNALMPPLFIYGGPSTGKTAIIRDIFMELGRSYGYVSCVEYGEPKALLQAVLNRLKGKKRKSADGYCGEGRSEQIAECLVSLQGAAKGPMKYIVLDHVERIRESDVLAVLLRLRELTGATIGLILISQVAWGCNAFEFDTQRCRRPHLIHFPGYKIQDLLKILELSMPAGTDAQLYKQLLSTFIGPMFARCSSRIEDLQRVAQQLYPEYLRPVREGRIPASQRQQLYNAFKDKAVAAKAAFENGLHNQLSLGDAAATRGGSAVADHGLDFELPFASKFLLLAAYVCSRNKPALDRRLFDPSMRGSRRRGAMASDKQAEAAAEAKLRGPHTFPLERLMGTYWELLYAQGEHQGVCPNAEEHRDALSADVFLQISSLVSLRFLSQAEGELDEPKYACNVSDELAERIAKNVKVSLKDYVFYV